ARGVGGEPRETAAERGAARRGAPQLVDEGRERRRPGAGQASEALRRRAVEVGKLGEGGAFRVERGEGRGGRGREGVTVRREARPAVGGGEVAGVAGHLGAEELRPFEGLGGALVPLLVEPLEGLEDVGQGRGDGFETAEAERPLRRPGDRRGEER